MKLAISNIGWSAEHDRTVYEMMRQYKFTGLEIAPTRLFPEHPYDRLYEAANWARDLRKTWGFEIPSMQSIWFGRQEKLFGSVNERNILLNYTKQAIDFAGMIGCKNLVFGCPRNRAIPDGADPDIATAFFRETGAYAAHAGTVIGMEANPVIYHTNYINDTISALALIKKIDSEGFRLNLDVGTMIQNGESAEELSGKVAFIQHVHISEPGLKPIEKRTLHRQLKKILSEENYQGFISIEMGKTEDLQIIENALKYVREIFAS